MRLTASCGALVMLIGGLTLLEWSAGFSFGIDSLLLFGREWGRLGVLYPGRMGPPGSLCWTLIGLALVFANWPLRLPRLSPTLGLATAGISAVSLIGYLYDIDQLYALPHFTVIAFQTSSFIMAVSIGIIVSPPDREPMRMLLDTGHAGHFARRALPLLIIVPISLGLLAVKGQTLGAYGPALGKAVLILLLTAFLIALVWRTLSSLQQRERGEHEAELRKLRNQEELRQTLNTAAIGLTRCSRNLRYVSVNEAYAELAGLPVEYIVGHTIAEVKGAEALETIRPYIEHVLSGERVEFESELTWPHAGKRWMHFTYTP
jgi:PAS domain S-box-containing protein